MAIDERRQVAHLLRRAGFGAGPAEVDEYLALGFEGSVERLLHPEAVDEGDVELAAEGEAFEAGKPLSIQARWLHRMVVTQRPLAERMAFFWHGHFATSVQKVKSTTLMWRQYETLRERGLGRFEDLLLSVAKDPAMLVWLDNAKSKKEVPNENFGRELLELFALGAGNYTEEDVKTAARAFTGWSVEVDKGAMVGDEDEPKSKKDEPLTPEEKAAIKEARRTRDAAFVVRQRWHDAGEKTFLGQTGAWDGGDIIRIAAAEPACARFVAGKLFAAFVWDNPSEETVAPIAEIFAASGGDVRETVGAILRSPEFSSEEAYRAKVLSPVELVAGTLRRSGGGLVSREVFRAMERMGQALFLPPHVGGWPSGLAWIGPSTVLERYNLMVDLLNIKRGVAIGGDGAVDPKAMVAGRAVASAAAVVDALAEVMLDGDLEERQREALLAYAETGAGDLPVDDPAFEGTLRGLVRLVSTVPAYQLR